MTLALLFWCYKEPSVCADRVRLLRHHNPAVPIYVLFGGERAVAEQMRAAVADHVDDFWEYDGDEDATWKWRNGDRVIAAWYNARGRRMVGWSRLFVVQWDMLVATNLAPLLAEMPPQGSLFSGRLPLSEVRAWWRWVRGPANTARLALFRLRMVLIDGYFGEIYSAPFIIVCAPRKWFEKLASARFARAGFIEYRCVTFAAAWGFSHHEIDGLTAWRARHPQKKNVPVGKRLIRALKKPIETPLIEAELQRPDGQRVFHPVTADDAELGLADLLYRPNDATKLA